jgi:hypothetical protein
MLDIGIGWLQHRGFLQGSDGVAWPPGLEQLGRQCKQRLWPGRSGMERWGHDTTPRMKATAARSGALAPLLPDHNLPAKANSRAFVFIVYS